MDTNQILQALETAGIRCHDNGEVVIAMSDGGSRYSLTPAVVTIDGVELAGAEMTRELKGRRDGACSASLRAALRAADIHPC